jgi:hypothetical protein
MELSSSVGAGVAGTGLGMGGGAEDNGASGSIDHGTEDEE